MNKARPLPRKVDLTVGYQLGLGGWGRESGTPAPVLAWYGDWGIPAPLDGHVHAGLEVGVVLSGRVEMHFTGASVRCDPGDVWLCGMWEPHAWRVMTEGFENIALIFLPDLVARHAPDDLPYHRLFAAPPGSRPRVAEENSRRFLLATAADVRRQVLEKGPLWRAAVSLDLLRILAELCNIAAQQRSPERRRARPRAESYRAVLPAEPPRGHARKHLERIMPAVKLVNERPCRRISVADAAAACALSPSRFRHVFREAMGVSFGRFRLRARLALVAYTLLHTNDTVETVASQAGFVDGSHLARSFEAHYGCTPTRYRARGE